jgi:nucleotide-binding universal stress UspA family protein
VTGAPDGGGAGARSPVLAAVDFSSYSESALLWACEYAAQTGRPLVVLHVVHEPAETPGYYARDPDHPGLPLTDLAARMMAAFLTRVAADHPDATGLDDAEVVLVEGLPVERILSTAEGRGAHLIVMGSQGRTGLPHVLIGSKAERVVRLSKIPVTIVKRPDDDPAARAAPDDGD